MPPKAAAKSSASSVKPSSSSSPIKNVQTIVRKKILAKRLASPDETETTLEPVTPTKRQRLPSRAAIESKESLESSDKSQRRPAAKKSASMNKSAKGDRSIKKRTIKPTPVEQIPVVVISDDEVEVQTKIEEAGQSEETVRSDEIERDDDPNEIQHDSGDDHHNEDGDAVSATSELGSQGGEADDPEDGPSGLLDDEAQEDDIEEDPEEEEGDKLASEEDDRYEGDELYEQLRDWSDGADASAVRDDTRHTAAVTGTPFGLNLTKLIDIQLSAIEPLINRGLLSCRRTMPISVRFDNGEDRNANAAGVYMELQTCRDVIQVTAALNFTNDGVFINPSRADPGTVKVVEAAYRGNGGEKLVLKHGPSASFGNAVFVSVIVVEDVKLREAVLLSGGTSERRQKRVTGCLFHGESELRTGFLGAALKYDNVLVSREAGADTFTTRMSPASTSSQSSPVKQSRFTERADASFEGASSTGISSYTNWPSSLTHDSAVPVFDFTALDYPFDFSADAWSKLHRCPKYALRFGEDEIGSDGVIGLVGYTINSYVSQEGRVMNQNVLFLAILARAGGTRMPLLDRVGLRKVQEYATRGGNLIVHPSVMSDEQQKKKGKGRAVVKAETGSKSPKVSIGKSTKAGSSKKK